MSKSVDSVNWFFVPYDQLNHDIFPWADSDRGSNGLIFVESSKKGNSKNFHKQKLALLLSNMRHFSEEAKSLGHPVIYKSTKLGYSEVLEELYEQLGSIKVVKPAERELRIELESLLSNGKVQFLEHAGWLTKRSWFLESVGDKPPFRMDRFYQRVRKETGILMEQEKPVGGKYSFDSENRFPWKGDPATQIELEYGVDKIDQEVMDLVNDKFSSHPGQCDLSKVPTTLEQNIDSLNWALINLPNFGRYEDAMSTKSRYLFHSKLATSINLHRLSPRKVIDSALSTQAPLNSLEGFFRQMIWREYVRHIHEVTDGFRALEVFDKDSGEPNFLNQNNPLPETFWGKKSGFNCLDTVVDSVMDEGWTHHIPRLMILSNFANLLDINPRELTTWFHEAFIDAYDWVVEPNVLGMGTYSLGDAMMTKPYISGTPYINKMSDYCKSCKFNPKKDCMVSNLYWAFLERHKSAFEGNIRMAMPLRSLAKRSDEKKEQDKLSFEYILSTLSRDEEVMIQS